MYFIAVAVGPRTDSEDVPVRIVDDFDEFVEAVSLEELVGELLFLRRGLVPFHSRI